MKPLRLRASNYRVFTELDLELPSGLSVILGEVLNAPEGLNSNGSGKSSILEGIDIALYGRRSLAGFLTRGGDATELMLELTFEHGGETYRVRRSFSARTKAGKTNVDFERFDSREAFVPGTGDRDDDYVETHAWTPLTCSSTKETDAAIVETIGLSLDAYRFSSYLRQGEGGIATRDPKQRKELLVEAGLGRDPVWPRAREAAKASRLTAQAGLERLAGETRSARELVETKADVDRESVEATLAETGAERELVTAETELQAIVERYQAAKDGAARRQACEAELTAAKGTLEQLRKTEDQVKAAGMTLAESRARLAALPTVANTDELVATERVLVAAIAAHEGALVAHRNATEQAQFAEHHRAKLLEQADEARTRSNAVRAAIAELEAAPHDEATCDRCRQVLAGNSRTIAVESMSKEANAHLTEEARLRDEAAKVEIPIVPPAPEGEPPTAKLSDVRAQLTAAQQAQQERVRLEERITACEATINSEPEIVERIAQATALVTAKQTELDDIEPVNLQAIEQAGTQARATVTAARAALDAAKTTRARLDERLATIAKASETLAAASVQERDLQATIDVETVIERACGRDGIPALIIENRVIPYLETEATRILGELGIGFSVELRTQSEKKDGSGLKDTLDVVVFDRDGNEADFAEGTSGGEQTRVGFVLQIALAEYLALTGRGSRLLAVDEPPYLDKSGLIALNRVLEDFVARGLFDQVLVVSHDAELRDSVEQTITVINDGGRSTIAGDAVLEPVEEIAA